MYLTVPSIKFPPLRATWPFQLSEATASWCRGFVQTHLTTQSWATKSATGKQIQRTHHRPWQSESEMIYTMISKPKRSRSWREMPVIHSRWGARLNTCTCNSHRDDTVNTYWSFIQTSLRNGLSLFQIRAETQIGFGRWSSISALLTLPPSRLIYFCH